MAEQPKMEVTNRELVVFFGSVFIALFIIAGGAVELFDPLTVGIAVTTIVVFFIMGQWLESRGVFGAGMSMVWIVFGLSVVMIISGLIYRGIIPLAFYSASTPTPALVITNAMLYALVVLGIIAVAVAVYVVYIRKTPLPSLFKKE